MSENLPESQFTVCEGWVGMTCVGHCGVSGSAVAVVLLILDRMEDQLVDIKGFLSLRLRFCRSFLGYNCLLKAFVPWLPPPLTSTHCGGTATEGLCCAWAWCYCCCCGCLHCSGTWLRLSKFAYFRHWDSSSSNSIFRLHALASPYSLFEEVEWHELEPRLSIICCPNWVFYSNRHQISSSDRFRIFTAQFFFFWSEKTEMAMK